MGERDDELWRLGIVLDAFQLERPFQELRSHPMRLLVWFSQPPARPQEEEGSALALCKLSTFDTFDNVHEYQARKGVQLRAASSGNCHYPHVTLASYLVKPDRAVVLMNLKLEAQSLERNTGLSRPTTPTILLASSSFLSSHGYTHMELLWIQQHTPLPLERVMVSGGRGGDVPLTPSLVGPAMEQLASLVERETVLVRQDTAFSLPGTYPSPEGGEMRHGTIELTVMECLPVCQGRLTGDTEVVVISEEGGREEREREEREREEEGEDSSFSQSQSFSLTGSCEPAHTDTSPETKSRSVSVVSNCSASDFRNEDDLNSDPSLELLTHPQIKLHRNFVIVPKQFATDHELYQYQMVVLEAVRGSGQGAGLEDMVLCTRPPSEGCGLAEGSHAAILMWFEGQAELECYLQPPRPGYRYHDAALQCAYVHPHLLYSLFSETLSPSRRYFISVKTGKGKGEGAIPNVFPKAKVVTLSAVGVARPLPPLSREESGAALGAFFQQRTHLLMTGDIFSVDIEGAGTMFYRIMDTSPGDSKRCDSTLREITWQLNKSVNFPLPCEAPPCPLLPRPPYFSRLLPPGLREPCLSLFSLLLPLLYSPPSARPPRTPAILISGPAGVGKTTVVRAVTRRARAHLLELNCYQYCSEPVATAEKRFMSDVYRALECGPCVVLLRNVHMLGRDAKRDEPRLTSAFLSFMLYISDHNKRTTVDFPIVVVATCPKRAAIPSSVAMEMLHEVELAPPTEAQRREMLEGVAGDHLMAPGIPWPHLARLTAGFVLGDLVALLSRAERRATLTAIQHYGSGCSSSRLSVGGVVISEHHLIDALSDLHSAHSDAIGAPKIPDVRWEDVGGLAEAKQEVLDAIQLPLNHPHLFIHGLRRSGVLLYGPPGTGKTLLAKAVATECGVHFLSVKGPELINMYVGQTEENVRDIFTRARGAAPCIIFFDELDSIAPSRGKTGDASGVMDRVVSQLLAEMDGLQRASDVFVIGATNRPDLLDSALLRPGRFDRLVYLGISDDITSRVKILTALTRKFVLAPDVDLHDLAARCPAHVTGADLYALCSEALLGALRQLVHQLETEGRREGEEGEEEEERLVVSADHFLSSLAHLTPSVSQSELEQYQTLRNNKNSS